LKSRKIESYSSRNSGNLPQNNPDELEQKLAELLKAEILSTGSSSTNTEGRSNQMNMPDLTVFQKQVHRNAAGYKTPSAFAETSSPFADDSDSENMLDDENEVSNAEAATPTTTSDEDSQRNGGSSEKIALSEDTGLLSQTVNEDDDNGFYLAPDVYERSRDMLNTDGSLDLGFDDGPGESSKDMKTILEDLLASSLESNQILELEGYETSTSNSIEGEDDLDHIWATVQKAKTKPFNASQSEQLYKKVFENEQGFLKQSPTFQKGLTDPQAARDATAERRSAKYRQRQSKAIFQLEQNMKEFEEMMKRQRPGATTCSRCQCKLSDRDFDIAPQLWMRQQNLTSLCESCYINLLNASRNPEKRLHGSAVKRTPPAPSSRPIAIPSNISKSLQPPPGTYSSSKTQLSQHSNSDKDPESDADTSSWVEVTDPDTGDTFYWNEETDEVCWDI